MRSFQLFCGALFFLCICISESIADDLQSSREAVSQLLKKESGGLVAHESKCPKKIGNLWEFVKAHVPNLCICDNLALSVLRNDKVLTIFVSTPAHLAIDQDGI